MNNYDINTNTQNKVLEMQVSLFSKKRKKSKQLDTFICWNNIWII